VPVLAAGLADVLVADPHPLVLLRREHHLLDQPPVALLDVGPVAQQPPVLVQALRQPVAQLLELAQRKHPGTAA
jgi:hypothetical protein